MILYYWTSFIEALVPKIKISSLAVLNVNAEKVCREYSTKQNQCGVLYPTVAPSTQTNAATAQSSTQTLANQLGQSAATTAQALASPANAAAAAVAAAAAQSAAGIPQLLTNAQGQIVAIGTPQVRLVAMAMATTVECLVSRATSSNETA